MVASGSMDLCNRVQIINKTYPRKKHQLSILNIIKYDRLLIIYTLSTFHLQTTHETKILNRSMNQIRFIQILAITETMTWLQRQWLQVDAYKAAIKLRISLKPIYVQTVPKGLDY